MNSASESRGRFTQIKDIYFPKGCGSYIIDFSSKHKAKKNDESDKNRIDPKSTNNDDPEFAETKKFESFSNFRSGRALDTESQVSNRNFQSGIFNRVNVRGGSGRVEDDRARGSSGKLNDGSYRGEYNDDNFKGRYRDSSGNLSLIR